MKLLINDKPVTVAEGTTILDAAAENGVRIPTLCHWAGRNSISACRICLVEVKGAKGPVPACSTQAAEGMEICTDTAWLRHLRKTALELLCANHRMECTECERGMNCELRDLCKEFEVDDNHFGVPFRESMTDESLPYLVRDNSKCVLCRRCESTCRVIQGLDAIGVNLRGSRTNVGFGVPLSETECVGCGQCIAACPTAALTVKDDTKLVWRALLKREQRTIAIVSPYVCARIGELFGDAPGTDDTGRTAAMLRRIGFDELWLCGTKVEACPAWRKYLQKRHPELVNLLPSEGGTPWEKAGLDCRAEEGKEAFITVITSCTALKGELPGWLDAAITVRELGAMWHRACVSSFTAVEVWQTLPKESFDKVVQKSDDLDSSDYLCGLAEAERRLSVGKLQGEELRKVLACPGGCAKGGGAPSLKPPNSEKAIKS